MTVIKGIFAACRLLNKPHVSMCDCTHVVLSLPVVESEAYVLGAVVGGDAYMFAAELDFMPGGTRHAERHV